MVLAYRSARGRGRALVVVVAVATMVLGGCGRPGPRATAPSNQIVVTKADRPRDRDLVDADVLALRDPARAPDVARVTPVITGTVPVTAQQTVQAKFFGSTTEYVAVTGRKLAAGDNFTTAQERSRAKTVLVGPALVTSVFGGDTRAAVGADVRVERSLFRIIGVLERSDQDDDAIIMPLGSARAFLLGGGGADSLNTIIVESKSPNTVDAALNQVHAVLDERHNIRTPPERDYTAAVK